MSKVIGIRCEDDEYDIIISTLGSGKELKSAILSLCNGEYSSDSKKLDEILQLLKKRKTKPGGKLTDKFISMGNNIEPNIDYSSHDDHKFIITAWEFWKMFRNITIDAGSKTTTIDKAAVFDWAHQLKLMIQKNETTTNELRTVYMWLKNRATKQSQFWAKTIKSTHKLREQYPRLLEQINSEEPQKDDKSHVQPNAPRQATSTV